MIYTRNRVETSGDQDDRSCVGRSNSSLMFSSYGDGSGAYYYADNNRGN